MQNKQKLLKKIVWKPKKDGGKKVNKNMILIKCENNDWKREKKTIKVRLGRKVEGKKREKKRKF